MMPIIFSLVTLHVYFTASLYNPSIESLCFSMAESQRLESFTIPSMAPILFICRMARKRRPRVGSFNFGNKLKSCGLMSGL